MTTGTQFRLFPQYASGYLEPEVVEVSSPAGSLRPGPSDPQMYTVYPVAKKDPYLPFSYMPPYDRQCWPVAQPDAVGGFAHLPVDSHQFLAAHLFGCARRTLDVWERYLGSPVIWWHAPELPMLELVTVVDWNNAQSGPGFLETGLKRHDDTASSPYCLNFDIVAHEIGHAILFSTAGVPPPPAISRDFLAFHESFSDLVALIGALHFDSVIDRLLAQTQGNLYVLNLVSRIGETSDLDQIRIADNIVSMADVSDLVLQPDGTWFDPKGESRNAHHYAQPLTGAIFDLLVDLYQEGLVRRGAIPPELDARRWTRDEVTASLAWVHSASSQAYARFASAFRGSLIEARDRIGECMAHVMATVDVEHLTFDAVAAEFLEALASRVAPPQWAGLADNFLERGIDPSRMLAHPVRNTKRWRELPYAERVRRVLIARKRRSNTCRHSHAFAFANSMMPHSHRANAGHRLPAL